MLPCNIFAFEKLTFIVVYLAVLYFRIELRGGGGGGSKYQAPKFKGGMKSYI